MMMTEELDLIEATDHEKARLRHLLFIAAHCCVCLFVCIEYIQDSIKKLTLKKGILLRCVRITKK